MPIGVKNGVFRQEVHYYMVYIAYFTELNLQICNYAQKQRICRENCKYGLDEKFCPRRWPSSATLLPTLSKFLPSINVDIIKTFQAVAGLFFRRENEPRGVQDSPVSKTEFCVIVSQTGDDGL